MKKPAVEIDPIFLEGVKDIPDDAIVTFYRLGSPELWENEMIRRGLMEKEEVKIAA